MFIGYVYLITNIVNHKKYVGQTTRKNINIRWNRHIKGLISNTHNNEHLQNSWNKYGQNNFKFEILKIIESDNKNDLIYNLDFIEDEYIIKFNTLNSNYGYNLKRGGNNGFLSEQTKIKISNSLKGKKFSEQRIKNTLIGKNNPFYGKKHSLETKQKISNITKERMKNIENRKKISEKLTGKKQSKETIEKRVKQQIGENNPFYGKKHSAETIKKINKKIEERFIKKYTLELLLNIYKDLNNNIKIKEIMSKYNITYGLIYAIKNKKGTAWKIINKGVINI